MRRSIPSLTAACVLALAACERPGDGQASSPQANSSAGAPTTSSTTSAGAASNTASGVAQSDWTSLDALVGRGPIESGLLDNSAVSSDLVRLLGDKLAVLKTNLQTASPLERQGQVIFASGNKPHAGGLDAAYILIDPAAKALEVGLWQGGKLSTYKTPGSNIAKPRDIQTLIANSR